MARRRIGRPHRRGDILVEIARAPGPGEDDEGQDGVPEAPRQQAVEHRDRDHRRQHQRRDDQHRQRALAALRLHAVAEPTCPAAIPARVPQRGAAWREAGEGDNGDDDQQGARHGRRRQRKAPRF
uniref:Uncharacterized protein n=1 Tax=Coralloluteibacterium stylophorae TaxID=1776034 RepID=A0A8J8AXD7_9GAMM